MDIQVLNALTSGRGNTTELATSLGIASQAVSNWRRRGIPAAYRPTIWAVLEERCPDLAAKLKRDEFLGVRRIVEATNGAVTPNDFLDDPNGKDKVA